MKFAILSVLATTALFGQVCEASQVKCSGSYLFFDFTINALISGSHVVGGADVAVLRGESVVRSARLLAHTSDVQPHNYMHFQGASASGKESGQLSAEYVADENLYRGTALIHASEGTFNVDVDCVLN